MKTAARWTPKDIQRASTPRLKVALKAAALIVETYNLQRDYAKLRGEPFAPTPNKDGRSFAEWEALAARLQAAIKAREEKIAS